MLARLAAIPSLEIFEQIPFRRLTRFELGGPVRLIADAWTEAALAQAISVLKGSDWPWMVIGGGSNLVASDQGFAGVVLRYRAKEISRDGLRVTVASGAVLQDLVDYTIREGLHGLETMTGIPGWVAGAVYGNAGAYGHSIHEWVERVRFFDGSEFREISNAECEFQYRESIFKRRKDWIITSAALRLEAGDRAAMEEKAAGILKIRNEKYPPTMRCAGSIFKNLLWKDLPERVQAMVPASVVREGKVPSAYFLEQAGAKGLHRGAIRVAEYHANLIYNEGGGTSDELRELILELKARVEARFGIQLEEEVQYVGNAAKRPALH